MLDTKQLSEELETPESTIRQWVRNYKIPVDRTGTGIKYGEEAAEAVRLIRNLRESGSGHNTIQRRLSSERTVSSDDSAMTALVDGPDLRPLRDELTASVQSLGDELSQRIESGIDEKIEQNNKLLAEQFGRQLKENVTEFTRSLEQNNTLAEKFGHVAHINGKLEAENAFLKQQLEKAESAQKLLPTVIEYKDLETRLEYQSKELERVEDEKIRVQALADKKDAEIESLRKQLQAEQTLSWWDKLIGKKPKPPD